MILNLVVTMEPPDYPKEKETCPGCKGQFKSVQQHINRSKTCNGGPPEELETMKNDADSKKKARIALKRKIKTSTPAAKIQKAEANKKYKQSQQKKIQEYNKNYYQKNKEKVQKTVKAYKENHKVKTQENNKKYKESQTTKVQESNKNYYENHKEKVQKSVKAYKESHKQQTQEKNKNYKQNQKEKIQECNKNYYQKHKDRIQVNVQVYKESHKQKIEENNKNYKQGHKKEIQEYNRQHYQMNKSKRADSYQSNTKCLKNFFKEIQRGPIFPCISCMRCLPSRSVTKLSEKFYQKLCEKDVAKYICREPRFQIDGQWNLCSTCYSHLNSGNLPLQCQENGLQLAPVPDCLKVSDVGNQLLAKNLVFIKVSMN